MTRYIRVITETPYDEITEYQSLDGDESEKDIEQIAADMFHNNCSYGYEVVDESEVPTHERR